MSGQTKPTIVFAHGLWADGSCYSKVIPRLLADGFQVISTQNHLNTVADDAAAVRTSFARAAGPVVLVGHSYGGTVITAAGTDERVAALVYICAFAPEEGDTTLVDQDKYPPTPIFKHIEIVDGRIWLRPSPARKSRASMSCFHKAGRVFDGCARFSGCRGTASADAPNRRDVVRYRTLTAGSLHCALRSRHAPSHPNRTGWRAAPLTCSPSSSRSWTPRRNSGHWRNRGPTPAPAPGA